MLLYFLIASRQKPIRIIDENDTRDPSGRSSSNGTVDIISEGPSHEVSDPEQKAGNRSFGLAVPIDSLSASAGSDTLHAA